MPGKGEKDRDHRCSDSCADAKFYQQDPEMLAVHGSWAKTL